jgi:anti-sigma factor RsiW
MEHERALEIQAVERYLIDDLSEAERNEFEEHFFSCEKCADEVRLGARFHAAAREVLRDPQRFSKPETERRSFFGWLKWFSQATAAAARAPRWCPCAV